MLYVGIDIAKYKHDFSVINDQGKLVLKPSRISNTRQGFELLHNTLKQLNQNCCIALEDTGHYAHNLLSFLSHHNYDIYTYNPLLIKEFNKSQTLRKTKTDKKDSKVIAFKCLTDLNRELSKYDGRQEELKILTRHSHRLKQDQTNWKVQYTKCLDIIFPELEQVVGKHNQYVYQLLTYYPSPKKILEAGLENLLTIPRLTLKHAQDILEVAKNSIGVTSTARECELIDTIQAIQYYDKIIKRNDDKINQVMDDLASNITTIPGIGNNLGAIILAEIRNIHHFKNPAQLQAFAGIEPSINQSGEKDSTGKMVKRGSPHLRWALLQAARLVARYSPTFKAYFRKKLAQGKHYFVALSHVAKKLTRVIFFLLKYNIPFDEQSLK